MEHKRPNEPKMLFPYNLQANSLAHVLVCSQFFFTLLCSFLGKERKDKNEEEKKK